MKTFSRSFLPVILVLGCGDAEKVDVTGVSVDLVVDAPFVDALSGFAERTEGDLRLAEGFREGAVGVTITAGLDCSECYEITGEGEQFTIKASDSLGAQYGLSALMEAWGYRFHHPFSAMVPDALPSLAADHPAFGEVVEPQMGMRSIHMHTLHPIEGLAAFWTGGEGEDVRAAQVIDWVIKNRGNDLQWVSLDDVMDASTHEGWLVHTQAVIAEAHRRGITVGLGIQLFGSGNLQQAFDLLDRVGTAAENRAQIEERLKLLTDAGFDRFNLSFGEFFGEDPDTFVAMVNLVGEVLGELDPDAMLTTLIHVGDSDDQKVVYADQEMIYYFLAQFADPEIVPWVHTVMFYNLYEDAAGAYHHEEFDEHRDFLQSRIRDGLPTAYFPESSYWIAFDNSVPVYLPSYMRSRWLDMEQTKAEVGPIPDHILFSSGWEWGYWQTDVATLRLNHSLEGGVGVEGGWTGLVRWMYAPLGADGARTAEAIIALAEAQAHALIGQRLMAYLAGRDSTIDIGEAIDVVAQPLRVRVDRLDRLDAAEREALREDVLAPLTAHAAEVEAIMETLPSADNAWLAEVRDGMEVTLHRLRFIVAVYQAGLAHFDGADPSTHLAEADAAFAAGQEVVARRKAATRDPAGERWMAPAWDNPTIYQYGYLYRSDTLCFWERERLKLAVVMGEDAGPVPGCAL